MRRWPDRGLAPALVVAGVLAAALPARAAADAMTAPTLGVMSVAVDAGLGEATVRGDWFWREVDGMCAQAGLRVAVSDRCHLHAVFRTQSLGEAKVLTSAWRWEAVRSTLRSYQLLIGTRGGGDCRGRPGMRAYLEGGGGLMETAVEVGGRRESSTRFALALQTGLWIPAGGNVAFDAAVHAFYKPGWLSDEAGGTSIGVLAAVMLTR